MPFELLTMLGSGIFGFVSKMWANNAADKAAIHKMQMEKLTGNRKALNEARKFDTPQSNMMRRFIVMALMSMLGFLLVAGMFTGTNLVLEVEGISILGLFTLPGGYDITQVEGLVAYPWMHHAILSIISFYFGTGAAKR